MVLARTDARYKGIVFEDLFALFGAPSIIISCFSVLLFFSASDSVHGSSPSASANYSSM